MLWSELLFPATIHPKIIMNRSVCEYIEERKNLWLELILKQNIIRRSANLNKRDAIFIMIQEIRKKRKRKVLFSHEIYSSRVAMRPSALFARVITDVRML